MNVPQTGLDKRRDTVFEARVTSESGRHDIERLRTWKVSQETPDLNSQPGRITLSVPDEMALVKSIRLEGNSPLSVDERVRFELVQSMLESEDNFVFGSIADGHQQRRLGMVFRREQLSEICDSCGVAYQTRSDQLDFQLRSIALGQGYLAFCHRDDGEMTCLTDLCDGTASICLVHGTHVVDVASIGLADYDLASSDGAERFAVDLKTLVNHRQTVLMNNGISVPLAKLLLSGEGVDDRLRKTVQTYFPVGVSSPRLRDILLGATDVSPSEDLCLFLVALGLAVN